MFTGIVEELGTVAGIEDQGDALRLTIHAQHVLADAGRAGHELLRCCSDRPRSGRHRHVLAQVRTVLGDDERSGAYPLRADLRVVRLPLPVGLDDGHRPVSYTHLDVYKRQRR